MQEVKFIADIMLGKLAKWLKVLGFDCLYFNKITKAEILSIALKESRIILTRNTKLKDKKMPKVFFINYDNWKDQLKEILSKYKPDKNLIFSRCVICNETLSSVKKEDVKDKVFPYVFETSKKFSYCKKCNKYYWEGTHLEKIKQIINSNL